MDEETMLAPCPFCGGEAALGDAQEAGPGAYVVSCCKCWASSQVRFAIKEPVDHLLREAWNRRADPLITSSAMKDVLKERQRQVSVEGFDAAHDAEHSSTALVKAAVCYLLYADAYPNAGDPPPLWPWDDEFWKPTDWRRDWVRGTALAIAAIDRQDLDLGSF
jgi:hypothetical protein